RRPSGDQNGDSAPSVPPSERGASMSSERTHSAGSGLSSARAENTSARPSGDTAKLENVHGGDANAACSGTGTPKRTSSGNDCGGAGGAAASGGAGGTSPRHASPPLAASATPSSAAIARRAPSRRCGKSGNAG